MHHTWATPNCCWQAWASNRTQQHGYIGNQSIATPTHVNMPADACSTCPRLEPASSSCATCHQPHTPGNAVMKQALAAGPHMCYWSILKVSLPLPVLNRKAGSGRMAMGLSAASFRGSQVSEPERPLLLWQPRPSRDMVVVSDSVVLCGRASDTTLKFLLMMLVACSRAGSLCSGWMNSCTSGTASTCVYLWRQEAGGCHEDLMVTAAFRWQAAACMQGAPLEHLHWAHACMSLAHWIPICRTGGSRFPANSPSA